MLNKKLTKITLQTLNAKLDKILELLKPIEPAKETAAKWNFLHMLPEYTAGYLFAECKKLFPCYSYYDLINIKSDRQGEYQIKFGPNIEADEDWKNLSANDIKDNGIKGITLPERLLLEIRYFKETGKHLDISNITLCAGSRYSDGYVPSVNWYVGRLYVSWDYPDNAYDNLRARFGSLILET